MGISSRSPGQLTLRSTNQDSCFSCSSRKYSMGMFSSSFRPLFNKRSLHTYEDNPDKITAH
eukprot:m.274231 g.274231  ORF g.274231 m.274231 type:complete len:61 (-) comp19757_c0_seq6:252-434(-)